jgi:hypothetical protein
MENRRNDTITYLGKAVPACTVSGKFLEGLGLAAVISLTGSSCLLASQDWIGSDMIYNDDGSSIVYSHARLSS